MLRQSQKKYSQPCLPWESRLAEETLGRLRHVPSEALRQHRSILQPEATHRDASTGDAGFAVPQVWFSREEHGCVIVCLFVRPLACLFVCLFACLFACWFFYFVYLYPLAPTNSKGVRVREQRMRTPPPPPPQQQQEAKGRRRFFFQRFWVWYSQKNMANALLLTQMTGRCISYYQYWMGPKHRGPPKLFTKWSWLSRSSDFGTIGDLTHLPPI